MHDHNGTLLKKGDLVLIPCLVQEVSATEGEGWCNLSLETLYGRRPDGLKEHFGSVNTAQVILAQRPHVQAVEPAPGASVYPVIAPDGTTVLPVSASAQHGL